ncbi:MAG: cell division protein FtsA [Bacteroidales bacterium]|jgi:cell division protein FtsA|nr:cell division protein FtsA [Bacteroidales bacterium]MDD3385736.1 cell division protein FtsA [Bacteroidales bacterium]MDD3811657.1 cell division protein FtsA [Bacteroidales bacterium]MDD3871134.1 cell division protein FtsA [Bacteroidales bacterium]MDD4813194.1 cell division protein FtsA [Bacteroidales bacterium]
MGKHDQIFSAIDIGTTKVTAIMTRKNEKGRFEILGLGTAPSTGVKRGVVVNLDETASAINLAVAEAEKQADIPMLEVYTGIASHSIRCLKNSNFKYLENEEITQADVDYLHEQMARTPIDPGEEIIHVFPQSYTVDNETDILKPIGMTGRMLEANFNLVIGKVMAARNISKCIERVELKVKRLIMEPLASAMAVLTSDEREAGVILVDIGGGTTDIAIYENNIIRHTSVIPFGGNIVTYDIKEGCSILLRQAEALKVQFGSALGELAPDGQTVTIPGISGRDPREISFRNLAYIIEARMEEILEAVNWEIENSGCAEKLSAGIVLTGGGAMLQNLSQLIRKKTGYDVRIGIPDQHLDEETESQYLQPEYSTAIGLVIAGSQTGSTAIGKVRFSFNGKETVNQLKDRVLRGFGKIFNNESSRF